MRIIPIMPIESMYGMIYQRAGYYIRRSSKGKLYSCRCPNQHLWCQTSQKSPIFLAYIKKSRTFAANFVGKTDKIYKKRIGKTDKMPKYHIGKTDKTG
jgi:hypothetical protein